MRLARLLLLLLLLLAFTACETTSTTPGANPSPTREVGFISLERTTNGAGVAAGPVYTVTLLADGRVMFEGIASVKNKGTFTRTIPIADASHVFRQIEIIDLWNRPRRYDVERTQYPRGDNIITRTASNEVPWDILRARNNGRSIRIDGLFFAPSDLIDFKTLVERTVGLAEWIGKPEEWQR